MFWFKLSIPDVTTFQLTEDMTILGNRRTGDRSQPHAYRFYFSSRLKFGRLAQFSSISSALSKTTSGF